MTDRPVTNKHLIESVDALRMLDSKEQGNKPRFKFDRVVRVNLATKLRRLADAVEDLEKAKKEIRDENNYTGQMKENGQPVDAPDVIKKVNDEWEAVLNAPTESDVSSMTKIKMSSLNLDVNQIEISVLATLSWLIENDLEDTK